MTQLFKIDLHTHSEASPDGGIRLDSYKHALSSGGLDSIAITDHNRIDFALHARQELGDQIIVGEEIMSAQGEIIGLYLTDRVQPNQSAADTVSEIKKQGGLVYIPHPFETVRKGLHPSIMDELRDQIDMVEVCNGRAFLQNRSEQAVVWARLNDICPAASSDAHGSKGLGKTYNLVAARPTKETLLSLVSEGQLVTDRPTLRSLLYPKYHRLRKKLRKPA